MKTAITAVIIIGILVLFNATSSEGYQSTTNSLENDIRHPSEMAQEYRSAIIWLNDQDDVDPVVKGLGDEFILEHRYENVPGIAGRITEDGFDVARQDKRVQSIHDDESLQIFLNESRRIIGADSAEYYGYTGRNQAACVIDTGVDYTHQNLGGCFGQNCKVVAGYDFANSDPDPMDDNGHGTHVAGIIASDHGIQRGIAPNANIVAIKACTRGGTCWSSDVVAGIDWCISNKDRYNIKAISMSLGTGIYTSNSCPAYMNPVIERAYQAGLFIAAASGNDNSIQGISYPACAPHVVSVGATYDKNVGPFTWSGYTPCTDLVTGPGKITCFTNRFDNLDILAPGAFITSTGRGSFYEDGGTSMAAPHVAASVLLVKEIDPAMAPENIESLLKRSGRPVYDPASRLTIPELHVMSAIQSLRHSQSPCYASRQCT